ncbi:MAG TPA: alpha/beta fold hydrolase, partial [Abditibacteriaceae bacterium]
MKKKLLTLALLAVIGFLLWQDAVMALLSIGATLILILPFLRWYEPRLIYYPHFPSRQHEQTPNALGFAFEEVHLTTQDGTKVHSWFVPVSNSNAPTVLFLHGNAGNISHRVERLEIFRQLGVHLLLLDYRGYGQSEGFPNETGTYQDALAAYEWLIQRGVAPQQIVIYGESLGTAIAVDLAAGQPCGGVVLEAPFTSISDMAQKMFPVLPIRR